MQDHNCYMYSDNTGTYCIPYHDIIWIEAMSNYVRIHVADERRRIVISKTLKVVEKELKGHKMFFRIDKSYIINGTYFDSFLRKDGGTVVLKNEKTLLLARRRRKDFQKFIALL